MSPPNLAASLEMSKEHTLSASEAKAKLEKIMIELEKVKAEKIALNPAKARKNLAPPINHAEKPKKTFSHPKLDFIYGEVMSSPYLTKPLDPYPREVFTVVHQLRELKRQGVKAIKDLPAEKQPYNPTKTRNAFIREVVNYEVSFLPKGYEEKKAKEMKMLEREALWEQEQAQQLQEILGQNGKMPNIETLRPISAGSPKKSHTLLGNTSRGGPDKYKKELRDMRRKRMGMTQEQRLKEMEEACAAVEAEARLRRQTAEHAKELARTLRETSQERAVMVDDDIHRFKDKAYRIKRAQVNRTERVSSPPHLLRRRFEEMDEEDFNKRGRSKSPPRLRKDKEAACVISTSSSVQSKESSREERKSQKKDKTMISRSLDSAGWQSAKASNINVEALPAPESTSADIPIVINEAYEDDFDRGEIAYEAPNFETFSSFGGIDGEFGSIADVGEVGEALRPGTGGHKSQTAYSHEVTTAAPGAGGRQAKKPSNVTEAVEEDFPEYDEGSGDIVNDSACADPTIEVDLAVQGMKLSAPVSWASVPEASVESDFAKQGSDHRNTEEEEVYASDFDAKDARSLAEPSTSSIMEDAPAVAPTQTASAKDGKEEEEYMLEADFKLGATASFASDDAISSAEVKQSEGSVVAAEGKSACVDDKHAKDEKDEDRGSKLSYKASEQEDHPAPLPCPEPFSLVASMSTAAPSVESLAPDLESQVFGSVSDNQSYADDFASNVTDSVVNAGSVAED